MLGLSPDEETSANLQVLNTVVDFGSLGGVKPSVDADSCVATVQVDRQTREY